MKKILAFLFVLAAALPALATPATVTVSWHVLSPDGLPASSGVVIVSLSTAGTAPDGAGSSSVASRVVATIAGDGSVSVTMVPNDIITPPGTYYNFAYNVITPRPSGWSEKRTVPTGATLITDCPLTDAAAVTAPAVITIMDEGTGLIPRSHVNFIGPGVACADNSGAVRTDCTVSGGGGGTPGGSSGQLQVNKSGTFVGSPGVLYSSAFATGGSGTPGSPWTSASGTGGVQEAVNACPANVPGGCTVILDSGTRLFTTGVSVTSDRVSLVGFGPQNSRIDFEPTTDDVAAISLSGASGRIQYQDAVRGIAIDSADTTHRKVGLRLTHVSETVIEDVASNSFTGGSGQGSIGLQLRGREHLWARNLGIDADSPVSIEDDPFDANIDGDHYDFNDCIFSDDGKGTNPIVRVATGLRLYNLSFGGAQSWNGGTHGFYMVDTTSTDTQFGFAFRNVRWEQAVNPAGYMFYIEPHIALRGLTIDNNYASLTTFGNGIHLKSANLVLLQNFEWIGASGKVYLDIDAASSQITNINGFNFGGNGTKTIGTTSYAEVGGGTGGGVISGQSAVFSDGINAANRVRVSNAGTAGADTSASAGFTANANSTGAVALESYSSELSSSTYAGHAMLSTSDNADLMLGVAGARHLRMTHANGYIGINTDSPAVPFDVLGDANVNGSFEAKTLERVRYAHKFATSGTGLSGACWATSGSNPISAAYADLVASGIGGQGKIEMIPGCYNLGTGILIDVANTHYLTGLTIEGVSHGLDALGATGLADNDAVVLQFNGTSGGAAFKVGNFTGSTYWAEGIQFKNFKLRNTGTAGTGIGFLLRLFRRGLFEDVTVQEFSTGVAGASVSDFNDFVRCRFLDNQAYGVDLARTTDETGAALPSPTGQCNGNRFEGCDFLLTNRDSGYAAWGLRIDAAAYANVVTRSQFHNFDTATYGGVDIGNALAGVASGANSVESSYFEGNYYGILFNNSLSTPLYGFTATDNYITQIEKYGIFCASSSTGVSDGIKITGNTFLNPSNASPYDVAIPIEMGSLSQNFTVQSNAFIVNGSPGTFGGGYNIDWGSNGAVTQQDFLNGSTRAGGAWLFDSPITVAPGVDGTRGDYFTANTSADPAAPAAGTGVVYFKTVSGHEQPFYENHDAVHQVAPLDSPAFTNAPTAPTQAVGDASTDLANDAFVSRGFIPRTAQEKKVCASGCDYSTVQAGLNAANGTSTTPYVLKISPGTYTECLTINSTQSYTTMVGAGGRYGTIINCNTGSTSTMAIDASAADILGFEAVGLSLTKTNTPVYSIINTTPSVTGDFRFELTFRDCYFGGAGSSDDFLIHGTSMTSPTKAPSYFTITNNVIEGPDDLVGVSDHLNVYSFGNTIRSVIGATLQSRCFSDVGGSGTYDDTEFFSSGDYCYAESSSTIATPSVGGSVGGVMFNQGFARATFTGFTAWVVNTSSSSSGAECFAIGASSGNAILDVSGTSCRLETRGSSQQAYGLALFGHGRAVLRNVRFESFGPGTETDLYTDSTSAPDAYIYLEGVAHSVDSFAGSAVVADLNPKVVKVFLRAKEAALLPATGATMDANGEFALFNDTTANNVSWRDERVSDYYQAQSLYAPSFKVFWRAASATTGNVVWKVGICASAATVAFPCTVSSFTSVTTAVNGTAGTLMVSTGLLPTGILAAGSAMAVQTQRDAPNGSDSATGNAELIGTEISYGVR